MRSFAFWLIVASCGSAFGQQPEFEVASVKATDVNTPTPMWIGMSADGVMVKYTNMTLRDCIRGAYRAQDFQIVGPEWMSSARFEIDAKLPSGASKSQIPEMLQTLLAQRFKLEIRRENREQNVYVLSVANGGAKLTSPDAQALENPTMALGPDGNPRPPMMYSLHPGQVALTAPAASLASLTGLMSRFTARPVVDMTGIEGLHKFQLTFAPEVNLTTTQTGVSAEQLHAGTDQAQSVFDSVKAYGLKLEARKVPVEMFVVTHLEKMPTEN